MDLAVTGPFASSLDDDKAKQRACAQETRKEMIKNTKPLLCSYHLIYYVLGLSRSHSRSHPILGVGAYLWGRVAGNRPGAGPVCMRDWDVGVRGLPRVPQPAATSHGTRRFSFGLWHPARLPRGPRHTGIVPQLTVVPRLRKPEIKKGLRGQSRKAHSEVPTVGVCELARQRHVVNRLRLEGGQQFRVLHKTLFSHSSSGPG